MNSAQAKQIHLKDLLTRLGHNPVQEDKGEHWYCSPFRQEQKASFKITRDGKGWYDHGAGTGGSILDFVMHYPYPPFQHVRDIAGALQALSDLFGKAGHATSMGSAQGVLWESSTANVTHRQATASTVPEIKPGPALQITKIQPLQNRALLHYVNQRCINKEIAEHYLQEIYYKRQEKPYFALAFANESGGYELRNPYFQGTFGTKDVTVVQPASELTGTSVAVFEGFMDFLSALTYTNKQLPDGMVIVLNSASMRERALKIIQEKAMETVDLYLDHDPTGRTLTEWFQEQLGDRTVNDKADLYVSHKDFNAWWMAQRQSITR